MNSEELENLRMYLDEMEDSEFDVARKLEIQKEMARLIREENEQKENGK